MTPREQSVTLDRLRRAALAFQAAESFFVNAHRRLAVRSQAEADTYWSGPGRQVKEDMRVAAVEAVAAAEGLVLGAADRRLAAKAQQYLAASSTDHG